MRTKTVRAVAEKLYMYPLVVHVSRHCRVEVHRNASFGKLYYYMRNFCNLIGLEQRYFSLI